MIAANEFFIVWFIVWSFVVVAVVLVFYIVIDAWLDRRRAKRERDEEIRQDNQ